MQMVNCAMVLGDSKVCVCARVCACMCVCMRVCVYACVCMHVYVCAVFTYCQLNGGRFNYMYIVPTQAEKKQ